jgi:hypothetical protein
MTVPTVGRFTYADLTRKAGHKRVSSPRRLRRGPKPKSGLGPRFGIPALAIRSCANISFSPGFDTYSTLLSAFSGICRIGYRLRTSWG